MSGLRTSTQLYDRLDNDFAWRIQEISLMKTAVQRRRNGDSKMLLRAGVMLLYAHWEGSVKNNSQWYLEFVSSQRYRYEELQPCFIVFGLKKQLNDTQRSGRHRQNTKMVEFLMHELGNRAQLRWRGAIDTQSNLSSTVFENIVSSIGINAASYETDFNFIDKSLLERRNRIAHGEFIDIEATGYMDVSDHVTVLLRRYKTDVENAVAQSAFLINQELASQTGMS